MRILIAALGLLPTPVLAAFDCTLQTMCVMATCEPAGDVAAMVQETAEGWTLTLPDTSPLTGTAIAGGAAENAITIAFPPQALGFDTASGLLNIYASGQIVFTVHNNSEGGVMPMEGLAVTFSGLCAGEGG